MNGLSLQLLDEKCSLSQITYIPRARCGFHCDSSPDDRHQQRAGESGGMAAFPEVTPPLIDGATPLMAKSTPQRTHAPRRVRAWGRGVWTLAGASVECRVMSGATAAGTDEAGYAEQRDGARGWDARNAKVRDVHGS